MVSGGLRQLRQRLDPAGLDILWVENVGNLVCPAEFEVGEHRKVALLSVTEGEDKPLKYPVMFREAHCVLITKTDLLPHLPVQVERIEEHIRQVNPRCAVIRVSATSGEGFDAWYDWLARTHAERVGSEAALQAGLQAMALASCWPAAWTCTASARRRPCAMDGLVGAMNQLGWLVYCFGQEDGNGPFESAPGSGSGGAAMAESSVTHQRQE